jgi:hypothetical protein
MNKGYVFLFIGHLGIRDDTNQFIIISLVFHYNPFALALGILASMIGGMCHGILAEKYVMFQQPFED